MKILSNSLREKPKRKSFLWLESFDKNVVYKLTIKKKVFF